DVDVRALPGVTPAEVDAMLDQALGDLRGRVTVESIEREEGSLTSPDTPLIDTLRRVTQALVPGSHIVPRLTVGATDAPFFGRGPRLFPPGGFPPPMASACTPLAPPTGSTRSCSTATTGASTLTASASPPRCGKRCAASSSVELGGTGVLRPPRGCTLVNAPR